MYSMCFSVCMGMCVCVCFICLLYIFTTYKLITVPKCVEMGGCLIFTKVHHII